MDRLNRIKAAAMARSIRPQNQPEGGQEQENDDTNTNV